MPRRFFTRPAHPPIVTALPTSPVDGEIVHYRTSQIGVTWQLRYRAAVTAGWEFVGGTALQATVLTAETKASGGTGYADLTTVGPQVVVPFPGEYRIEASFNAWTANSAALSHTVALARQVAGAGAFAELADAFGQVHSHDGMSATAYWWHRVSLTANDVIKMMYGSATPSQTFRWRRLAIQPVRLD